MHDFLHYLGSGFLWKGLLIAMEIAVVSFVAAIPFALGVAVMRLSRNRLVRMLPGPYIWVMRGTPILLQLLFWYNVLPLIGIQTSAIATAIIGLALNEVAFMAEIFRGGLQAVKQTQRDAAAALGMRPFHILRRVVLPQALRSIAPALSNEAIILVKNTSLASVITVGELTLRSEQVVSTNFQYVAVFLAAAVLYLVATTLIVFLQGWLEARLDVERKGTAIQVAASRRREAGLSDSAGGNALRRLGATLAMRRRDGRAPAPRRVPGAGAQVAAREPLALKLDGMQAKDGEPYVVSGDVRKSFHGKEVLKGVSLDVEPGSVVFLIGPSGSGKTTLLRTINHLETIDGGEITVGGMHVGYRRSAKGLVPARDVAVARAKCRIGMVFQHFNLFDHLTVMENIMESPVKVYGRRPDEVRAEARELLAWAGLAGYEEYYPHQLSGGQQQRIAIIRAVATHPRLMLFDEPTSALDPELVGEVLTLVRRLAEAGMTMVVVSHEIVAARDWADKVVFMEDGCVVEEGSPEQIFRDARSERTRSFLRKIDERGTTEGAANAAGLGGPERAGAVTTAPGHQEEVIT
ncbi:MAG TPA: amino acid ABC transporter permease/ATP-binding protein [Solirubrobacteraceae bacterium]|nr:amino acid ABC transporter permease/ATP-binding protein [Solirubrobacteraceae bacterium]